MERLFIIILLSNRLIIEERLSLSIYFYKYFKQNILYKLIYSYNN